MIITQERNRQLDGMVSEINIAAQENIPVSDDGVNYSYDNDTDQEFSRNQNKLKKTLQYSTALVLLAIMMVLAILGSQMIFGRYDDLFYRLFKNTASDSNAYNDSKRV